MASNMNQNEAFDSVKKKLADTLSAEILSWDFPTTLNKLDQAIETHSSPVSHNGVRHFSRHYLKLAGDRYRRVRRWITGKEAMTAEEITLVLKTLSDLESGKKVKIVEKHFPKSDTVIISEPRVRDASGVTHKLVDHSISIMNSLLGLIIESGLRPSDVYDGDRMQIINALQRICPAMGIKVNFPEAESHFIPVTKQDIKKLESGFKNGGKNE
jgi:hypothetical protein